ncbi:hypothetical protein, partial [Streptococcus gordonii]|uniref:hypothetical protein n=1 Tax=Streptococcus gordonii TaxID=1302 RepID=UPI0023B1D84C
KSLFTSVSKWNGFDKTLSTRLKAFDVPFTNQVELVESNKAEAVKIKTMIITINLDFLNFYITIPTKSQQNTTKGDSKC